MTVIVSPGSRPSRGRLVGLACLLAVSGMPIGRGLALETATDHLVVSEVVTGGASASDEFIEIHNPTGSPLPLEGLELVYVTATGATVTRRANWTAETPALAPGAHLLVANEAGIYAADADALYTSGMAATGGSVALRLLGGTSAIDAVGWGTATSTWREGTVAPAPAAGSSLERLPGGALGSGQDTDDNVDDFAERSEPDPQSLAAPPTPDPGTDPDPTGPLPTAAPTSGESPTPLPSATSPPPTVVVSVDGARALPDGTEAIIEAFALTASDFHDGGGFVADATGAIAVLLEEGRFERSSLLRLKGTLDDRFSQRTLRVAPDGATVLGSGVDPAALPTRTADVGESLEGRLVRLVATVVSSQSVLTSGVALDVDDGSGPARVAVGSATGIDLTGWLRGATVDVVGVVGQRDSTGTGADGYRVLPRDAGDVLAMAPPASATPSPTPGLSPTPGPTASEVPDGVVSIAEARGAARNARLMVRGVVTLGSGIVDTQTAVIQDATGAIVLRLGDEAGSLETGQSAEVTGARSTKSGMETLRITDPPALLGAGAEPTPLAVRTGAVGEDHEALLVTVSGTLGSSARRASAGSVTMDLDDGSGPLRIHVPAALEYDDAALVGGVVVEVTGVVGQETTGAQPLRGYRVWPRSAEDIRVLSSDGPAAADGSAGSGPRSTAPGAPTGSLAGVDDGDLGGRAFVATLVSRPWPELGIGGLLWDGARLVALDPAAGDRVDELLTGRAPPMSLELSGLRASRTQPETGVPVVSVDAASGSIQPVDGAPAPPRGTLPDDDSPAAWVSLIGSLDGRRHELRFGSERVAIEVRCDDGTSIGEGRVRIVGIATGDPRRVIVPCGGIERAPLLAVLARRGAGGGASPQRSRVDVAAVSELPRRGAAAGVLVVGALLVGGAAWAARRGRRPDDPNVSAAANSAEPETDVPRLRLLNVPREHGP